MQTPGYVSRFEPLLYVPPSSDKRISTMSTQDLPQRDLDRGIIITTESTQLHSLKHKHLHKRWALSQSKEKITLGDHKDHNHSLCDLKGSQIIFSQKDPKDRYRSE